MSDRVVWSRASNGIYSAKEGYRFWYDENANTTSLPVSRGWGKFWQLLIPHKMKIFIWRFCRNNVPVHKRLRSKGANVPITCPLCVKDIEHMTHIFFDYDFATDCWRHMNLVYDMREVEVVSEWLLDKLEKAPVEESSRICTVSWGIWYWLNKKVWEDRVSTPASAMDGTFSIVNEWKRARQGVVKINQGGLGNNQSDAGKWLPPEEGMLKVNVDASMFQGSPSFTVGMVLRDSRGSFIAGRNLAFPSPDSVFEAEAIGMNEALSWIMEQQLQDRKIIMETDSLLTVQSIRSGSLNCLEVGEVLDLCRLRLQLLEGVSVHFVRNYANRVAYEIARFPYLVNCQNYFTSPLWRVFFVTW